MGIGAPTFNGHLVLQVSQTSVSYFNCREGPQQLEQDSSGLLVTPRVQVPNNQILSKILTYIIAYPNNRVPHYWFLGTLRVRHQFSIHQTPIPVLEAPMVN